METMPVVLEIPTPIIGPPHKRWTREEYSKLEKTGLIDPERYELIEGELIQKMGKNHPHMLTVMLLGAWLRKVFGEPFVVQEPTIDLRAEDNPTSEPEPDLVLTCNTTFLYYNVWHAPTCTCFGMLRG